MVESWLRHTRQKLDGYVYTFVSAMTDGSLLKRFDFVLLSHMKSLHNNWRFYDVTKGNILSLAFVK